MAIGTPQARNPLALLRQLEWRVRHAVENILSGEYRSAFRGRGMEFDQVVRYQFGDDVRDIDWNVTAKLGEPYRKKFVDGCVANGIDAKLADEIFAFVEPFFFIGYLISIAMFGLFQAIFMADAGGAWDNAKKIVETELKQKGTPLHEATVVGDIVGDPFKDTSSVALNPIIKFTTLFGLLAVELAVSLAAEQGPTLTRVLAGAFMLVALVFIWKSFYGMRIDRQK